MNVTEALKLRRTTRGFLGAEVPKETLLEIVELARLAPSNSNTQPWHIAVASGETRQILEAAVLEEVTNGMKPHPQWPPGGMGLQGDYKQRQYDCADRYYRSVGITRADTEARQELLALNWKFFGAPHAAFISMPAYMHRAHACDLGIFLQTLMLLMTERGIASCPQGALAAFPDVVKRHVSIPEENAILVGLSFGYADEEARINSAKMPREPLDSFASFHW